MIGVSGTRTDWSVDPLALEALITDSLQQNCKVLAVFYLSETTANGWLDWQPLEKSEIRALAVCFETKRPLLASVDGGVSPGKFLFCCCTAVGVLDRTAAAAALCTVSTGAAT